jgi:ubiquinone/menaquinone biosynthesis C-methylase UbiE
MPEAGRAPLRAGHVIAGFDAAAARYDNQGVTFFTEIAGRLLEQAGLKAGDRVLDLGCGAGALTFPAASAVGREGAVTGIDLSAQMLKRAAAVCAGLDLNNVTLARADALHPPYAAGSFDAVLGSMMIFLLADPRAAAQAWLKLLRPGGTLAFSWNVAEDERWRPVVAAVDAHVPSGGGFETLLHHPPFGSTADVETMLSDAGFTAITTAARAGEARYAGPRQWWAVSWSQAPRIPWGRIPHHEQITARNDAFRLLDGLRDPDGTLIRRSVIGYTVARRPAPATDGGMS